MEYYNIYYQDGREMSIFDSDFDYALDYAEHYSKGVRFMITQEWMEL